MKDILCWLVNPYVHVLLFGLLLVCCAVDFRSEEFIEAAEQPLDFRSFKDAGLHYSPATQVVSTDGDACIPW